MTPKIANRNLETAASLAEAILDSPDNTVSLAVNYVVEQVQSGQSELTDKQIKSLKSLLNQCELAAESGETKAGIEASRHAFIERYGIKVLGESQVALIVPDGTPRINLLHEAEVLCEKLYGRDLAAPNYLWSWERDQVFTSKVVGALELAVDGNVKKSTNMTRLAQEGMGWLDVSTQDLVIAHAAFFIATGKDLFNGNTVRTKREGILVFSDEGLVSCLRNPGTGYDDVAACRLLPFPD